MSDEIRPGEGIMAQIQATTTQSSTSRAIDEFRMYSQPVHPDDAFSVSTTRGVSHHERPTTYYNNDSPYASASRYASQEIYLLREEILQLRGEILQLRLEMKEVQEFIKIEKIKNVTL